MHSYYFIILASLVISGCANSTKISVDRKVYHTLGEKYDVSGKTFSIQFFESEQGRSLEHISHSEKLAEFFSNKGIKVIPIGETPDFVAQILFDITGEEKVRKTSSPVYAPTGGTSSFSSTSFGRSGPVTTYGTVYTAPGMKQVGTSSRVHSYTEYTRVFFLKIYRGKDFNPETSIPIYEGIAISEGSSRDTTKIYPILISSLLHDFPSRSGVQEEKMIYFVE
jgi:hypothetical protein